MFVYRIYSFFLSQRWQQDKDAGVALVSAVKRYFSNKLQFKNIEEQIEGEQSLNI